MKWKVRWYNMDLSIYDDFIVDYNNSELTIDDIKRKYGLNCRRFAEIQQIAMGNGDIPQVRRMNRSTAKFYTKTRNGFVVKKQFGTSCNFIGRFEDEETAQLVVNKCKEVNWNTSQISDFIDAHRIKPKNYTAHNGSYIVQKVIDGKNTVICKANNESTARKIVEKLRECNWNKEKINEIIEKVEA